ncbi:leucine-rich repeat-containing protein 71-like isoform X3 [Physella acuta]|uniref:leucine-rich repeat-containing protein 71-like isoform X3 n=1 Tax=Physella acuta TaxID=109671 RepID=UPI0027DE4DB4|nr:leucine-rich repeat-containing protein 71-like isoform X3 [Physella acuta]
MGKKVEKNLSKDRHLSSAHHEDESLTKTPEPYKCVGNFLVDFTELCKQNSMAVIPSVTVRPKPPAGQSGSVELKSSKKEDKKQVIQVHDPEPDTEHPEDGEVGEWLPKTYTTKPKSEYFKPSVQVELDVAERWDTVTEVHVRGWKIDTSMMETFRQCWTLLERLHTINLWNTGLTEASLVSLAAFLPLCLHLRNVILDGNNVKGENWSELIGADSLIQMLSLRHCGITDTGACGIGRVLGNMKAPNTKLISLNLSGNLIGDVGAESLAWGLRMNRTLMALTLLGNNIGNKGAMKISEALSRFPLSHEETVERRKLLSDHSSPERKSPALSRRAESKDRPGSVRSMTTTDKTKLKQSAKKKEVKGKDTKDETKTVKKEEPRESRGSKTKGSLKAALQLMASASVAESAKSQNKAKEKKKEKTKSSVNESDDSDALSQELSDQMNPLLETTDLLDGNLWIAGNRTLILLNLSRNKIGAEGIEHLLRAVQYQTTLTSLEHKPGAMGLMRLALNKNPVPADNESLKKILDLMQPKDPFYISSVVAP